MVVLDKSVADIEWNAESSTIDKAYKWLVKLPCHQLEVTNDRTIYICLLYVLKQWRRKKEKKAPAVLNGLLVWFRGLKPDKNLF